jgi:hypothetical protein
MRFQHGHRSFTRTAIALLAALSVLASFVLGGHRYFYCAVMNEVSLDACCEPPSASTRDDGPGIEGNACCITEHFASAGPGVRHHEQAALRSPFVAALGGETPRSAPRLPEVRDAIERRARAGPGPANPREHRLRLMVFLT